MIEAWKCPAEMRRPLGAVAAIEHAGGKEQVVDTIEIRPRDGNIGYNGLMHQRSFASLQVRPRPGNRSQGWLNVGSMTIPVALGRGGIRANKLEGDGATPRGDFRLLRLWYRADRHPRPRTTLPVQRITPDLAWCEDPGDRRYNRPFRRRDGEPGDRLRRADNLYDYVIEIDHNARPRVARRGSAVFIHVARPGLKPTAGCIALPLPRLRRLLERLGPQTSISII
jgi:L,D-peptidoglycan transpeptidase YkuD (ErfK/YbiS/YcfS/YnhG family)